MSILTKLFTALRGGATEVGEAVVDNQAIRILEQEMRDAKKHLNEAKQNLASVMAEQIGVDREVKRLKKDVTEHEGYAMQALEQNDEPLAIEIADKIAELSNELEAQEAVLEGYTNSVSQLKNTIRQTERNVKSLGREVSVVKTTESVQKASSAAAARFSGSNSALHSATDSLERIKARQQKKTDQMNAAMQMQQDEDGTDLQAKLKSAGIVKSAASSNSILERLKAKQSAGS